ncbi:hypothetical protein SAMN02745857_03857 [Andreprevotia lacus DSM 23236]|uniref:DUF7919 domain-containing protein n=1 Tax=Andreprevotia lacus DSM 23236 TaxID=1121001 RepID=A0A1W1XZS0_9NEIS|nr:hypothetical protein [Andreprevotia lacus]SMC29469.1 hypothetical protein SAMN02745857_03857 [Andreprevotia lacus DSM 23236]
MPHYPDLAPYAPDHPNAATLRAVGWLAQGQDYPQGAVPAAFYRKLVELCAAPWQPAVAAGVQQCVLCQVDGPHSGGELYVPHANEGLIYIAPVAIAHYVASHWYLPPPVFVAAVLACPPMRSVAYHRAMLACGGRGLLQPARA